MHLSYFQYISERIFCQELYSLCVIALAKFISTGYSSRMKVRTLQENLRKALWKRIDAGELTGLKLADLTGFKQAHISNFLNRKRQLSIEGFDNLLGVARLSVLDLLDPN